MSRFTRSLVLFGLAAMIAILVFGASGLSAQVHPVAQNGPQTYPTGTLMVVNSSADTNARDSVLTLREALLIADGELADSLARCITNSERDQVFSTTWWPATAGAGNCNYITGYGGSGAADTIAFHTSINVVTVTASLPVVDCGDIIRSNPFDLARRVTIDGTSAGNGVSGLTLSCGGESDINIGYVTIQNFNGSGIYAQGLMTATLTGLDLHGNGTDGIYLGYTGTANSRGNQIGTVNASDRNYIYSNGWNGIEIEGNRAMDSSAQNNHIENNVIGLGTGGSAALGNTFNGVYLHNAWQNWIGGSADKRNIISGNNYDGIKIEGDSYAGNFVTDNYIGTNVNGALSIGNLGSGISLIGGTGNNVIGNSGSGNVIAGNTWGVFVNSNDNTIVGNYIGTNAASASGLGNSVAGVHLNSGASGNLVGGTPSGWGNVISGNSGPGIVIDNAAANIVELNRIGTNTAGTAALPNATGVLIQNGASGNQIGTFNTTFSNLISGNSGSGIVLDGAATHSNEIYANRIGTNLAGMAALPNTVNGLTIQNGAYSNFVGDTGHGNLIGGNAVWGVDISTNGNTVLDNWIGTDSTGAAALPNAAGLKLSGGAKFNTIGDTGQGNVVSGNAQDGVQIIDNGTSQNSVYSNTIGLNATATAKLPNSWSGVAIVGGASNNAVGGVGLGNTIAGNGTGVFIGGGGTQSNVVSGNFIGTNLASASGLGNTNQGVDVENGTALNIIGGTATGQGNVISGNGGPGVQIWDSGTTNTTLQGNTIGLNVAGTAALPNHIGVNISNGAANTLIGADSGGRNLISGNIGDGISVDSSFTTTIVNNVIGLSSSGLAAVSNSGNGVGLYSASNTYLGGSGGSQYISGNGLHGVYALGASHTLVNDANYIGFATNNTSALGNGGAGVMLSGAVQSWVGGYIGYNSRAGVAVAGDSNQNKIIPLSNRSNLGIPIDLGDNGATPNDPGDADTGPNGLLNYPVLTAYSGTTITGTACANCTVFIYQAVGNPVANGGGANWSGNQATANASGVWMTSLVNGLLPTNVTLQTCEAPCGPFSNTSEFSPVYHDPSKVYLPLVMNNYSGQVMPTPPAAPTQLNAVTASTTSINLTWTDNSINEDGFKVEMATGVGSTTFVQTQLAGASVANALVSGLTPGTSYTFRVRAYNSAGNSGYSNSATAVTSLPPTLPEAPAQLSAVTASTSGITLTWADKSSNEDGFKIELATGVGSTTFGQNKVVGANVTNTLVSGLMPGVTYIFRVRAYNSIGHSGYSNLADAVTTATGAVPAAPSDLIVSTLLNAGMPLTDSLGLDWTDNSTNETVFIVESSRDGVTWNLEGDTGAPNDVSVEVIGLLENTFYCFRVRAHNANGDSNPSDTACGSTPTNNPPHAPTNLSLQVISSTTLLLMWVNPDNNDGYHLYQSDNGQAYALIGTWTQGNLAGGYIEGVSGHTYTYKIRAFNVHGDSPDSAPSNSVQMPAPASNTLTRFVNNAAYPIVSLQIDGVEQFPAEPQGVPPNGTFEKQLAMGQHTYRAATGFWSSGSRVEMYVYNGTFNQQANVIGVITLNNPTLGQVLTRFSSSGYYVGQYWSGTNPNSKAFRFYSNGSCGYYLNGVLQGGACSTSPVSYLGDFIVKFNVSYSAGTFQALMDERTGSFSLRNGPADWPIINYSYDGH